MLGTLNIKTRPIRLAFLVDPNNATQVREAIRLASSLWGGFYFPIIPIFGKRMPATWRDGPLKAPSSKDVVLGYIDAFDPDILVQLSKKIPDFVKESRREIIQPRQIWTRLYNDLRLSPQFGLGIFELLNDIYDLYFKFKRKYPVKVIFPKVPKTLPLFWVSWLGEMPKGLMPTLKEKYFEPLEIEEPRADAHNVRQLLAGDTLFPRRIVQHGINKSNRSGRIKDGYVFYMDATKIEDVIDFWNLRAVGGSVLPLPKQLQNNEEVKALLISFLKMCRRHWPHDKSVCDTASFVRSRNSTMEEMQEFTRSIKIDREPDDPSTDGFFLLQHWYPRIWDEWGRDKDFVQPTDIYGAEEESIELTDVQKLEIRFRSLLPKFSSKHGYHGEPRCANEIDFRYYGLDEHIAEVFPKPSGEEYERTISGFTSLRGDWRVGRNGLVKLVRDDYNETRQIPRAEDVFFAWLRDLGWKAKLSAPGILAKQIFKTIEGRPHILKNEKLLGLLEHMNGGLVKRDGGPAKENKIGPVRELEVGEVKNRLARESIGPNSNHTHDYLAERGVFNLGAKMQCPHCTRKAWFSLNQLRDDVTCPMCLNTFPAIGNLDRGGWCYRTTGPFSVPNYADGAYTVILSIECLAQDHSVGITPTVSFSATSETNDNLEADFAAFWRDTHFGEEQSGILFGECKSYNVFEKKDYDRMRYLGKTFPGSILVFSTLRKALTNKEKLQISRIAKSGRKYWKSERPINPVLILTGNELFHSRKPPYCWDEATRKKFDPVHSLIDLCNATQQIYLGLPSWHDDWHKKWEKIRDRKRGQKRS